MGQRVLPNIYVWLKWRDPPVTQDPQEISTTYMYNY